MFLQLKQGEFHAHSVRPKDQAMYKSDTYQVFWLVYDRHNNVVKHFYVCKDCGVLMKIVLTREGNSKMTRHPCFIKWVEAQTTSNNGDDECERNDEFEIGDQNNEVASNQNKTREESDHDDDGDNSKNGSKDDDNSENGGEDDESKQSSEASDNMIHTDSSSGDDVRPSTSKSVTHKLTITEFGMLSRALLKFSEIFMKAEYIGVGPLKLTDIVSRLPRTLDSHDW